MPSPAYFLLLATLLPMGSFLVLLFIGKRMGQPLAGWLATATIGASFLCSMLAMIGWMQTGRSAGSGERWGQGLMPITLSVRWVPVGSVTDSVGHANGVAQSHPGWLDASIYVDSLTIAMFAMVTLVATAVHLFSIAYMAEDRRFARFFAYLGLFCFSMLGLLLSGTILQLFVFWELVGLCSYLLIGFWFEKKTACNAAIKAFIVNRIGDFGFMVGFGLLSCYLGNASLPQVWLALGDAGLGKAVALPDGTILSTGLLTLIGIGLFCGAVGKSAQFPLHVWLADAMEGPTPVSALIHAATMVAAGVYLVGRVFPILTPDAKLVIAIVGVTTLTMAALIATVQTDIKRILAFSTLSQLGYMTLAMGVGSWVGGMFHLITHAFFKSLLFLGAGSVIHAARHEQEVGQFGGLLRKIPVTGITFAIAVLAIAGTPLLSGYYSKEMILTHAGAFAEMATHAGRSNLYWLLFILPTAIAYLTAFYMTRCWMLTFWGKPRNVHLYARAREHPMMWVPLIFLAALSVISGWRIMSVRDLLRSAAQEARHICLREQAASDFYRGREFNGMSTAWPGSLPKGEEVIQEPSKPAAEALSPPPPGRLDARAAFRAGEFLTGRYGVWAFAVGIGAGFLLYLNGLAAADRLLRVAPLRWLHQWLYHRMYFDELYFAIFVSVTMAASRLAAWFDRFVIDGCVNLMAWFVRELAFGAGSTDRGLIDGAVTGIADLAKGVGVAARAPQTGRIRAYVTALMVAAAVGAIWATAAALWR